MNYLTSTFSPLNPTFIFRNMLGVLPKLELDLLLEVPLRRKWVFTQTKMNERWMFKELIPFFFSKNPLNFFFFFWRFEQDFHEKQTTFKKGREWRAHSQLLLSLLSENGRILILKGNETLNLMVEKKSQKEIIWINLPLHLDGSRNKGT